MFLTITRSTDDDEIDIWFDFSDILKKNYY